MASSFCNVQTQGGGCLCEPFRRFEWVAGNDGEDESDGDDRSDLRRGLRGVGTCVLSSADGMGVERSSVRSPLTIHWH